MLNRMRVILLVLCMVLLFSGCTMRTVDEMYAPPKRSEAYNDLQSAIDDAMVGLEYSAPENGENQQTVQQADLDGDGQNEYLLFARGSSEKPMQILIFAQNQKNCQLIATIESSGFSFEQVEYVQVDDRPGVELVVGYQVSDQLPRSVSIYSFASGQPERLMSDDYSKFLTCDLNQDGFSEVMLLQSGETEADNGVAVLYGFAEGSMERSLEVNLSGPVESIKRIMTSSLESDEAAVYVASAVSENAIITDIFAMKDGWFTNISFSSESGTSVQTLRNYYVYADDIDGDGVLELPSLITMVPLDHSRAAQQQYLIRWYSMDIDGQEMDKRYTYHNYSGGWYLELDSLLTDRVTVVQEGSVHSFYLWDSTFGTADKLLSVASITGTDREERAQEDGSFVLYRGDGVLYAAKFEVDPTQYNITQEELINRFHPIHQEWKTGET